MNATMKRSPSLRGRPAAVGGARSRRVRLKLFELVDVGGEAAGTILEFIRSCDDNEFLVDVHRHELERHPARAQRG